MTTARTLCSRALITAGIITPNEEATSSEIDHALMELNLMIQTWNQDNLWPYTSLRVHATLPANKKSITIGEGEGLALVGAETDGVKIKYTPKRDQESVQQDLITIVNTDNYNKTDQVVLEATDRSIIIAPDSPDATESVLYADLPIGAIASPLQDMALTFNAAYSFQIGDVIVATDNNQYSVSGTVSDIISPTVLRMDNLEKYEDELGQGITGATRYTGGGAYLYADRITYPKEVSGYVFEENAVIPDIVAPRPDEMQEIQLIENTFNQVLVKFTEEEWDGQGIGIQTISASYPRYYTYFTTFPFGSIELRSYTDKEYPVILKYPLAICDYDLSDELNLPAGYEPALQYMLASLLGVQYGVNVDGITAEATNRLKRLKRQNYKPSVLQSDLFLGYNRWNYYTDRFY